TERAIRPAVLRTSSCIGSIPYSVRGSCSGYHRFHAVPDSAAGCNDSGGQNFATFVTRLHPVGKHMKATATLERSLKIQSKNTVIHFDEGLIGFSECKDFQLMENDNIAPFHLLRSARNSEVGFLVLEPSVVMADYYSNVPEREWESIGVSPLD